MKPYLKILLIIISLLSLNGCVMRDGKIQRASFSGAAIKNMEGTFFNAVNFFGRSILFH